MESLKNYFLSNPSTSQVLLYAGIILSLWLIEAIVLGTSWKDKWKHTLTNTLFIGTALPVQLFMTIFVLIIASWGAAHSWGLLFVLPYAKSYFTKYFIGFILLDFCEYLYHVIMHKVKPFWNLHLVHHSDLQLDVSTTVREHPAETFLRMCFLMLWVFLLGASFGVLLLRQTLQTVANITSHTKFRLPAKANQIISLIFITPNLHHVHHHYQLPYTDRNYGDVLSIWDRLFNTFHQDLPVSEITYGIDTHMDPKANASFLSILKIPFLTRNK
ncbi:sterol desaturase/sphingolipid hydroxylase (fatty acid hydroxylase superfamily) [Mucilaginibacter frigoritolerans]|uniref:Sterol desaturase/sphingolipid hydroxylase (Fatty acid hydroxylase superfamily) n=1 Tax=Mucilaginibacter frigoritolerans TaxID=652788 RepID=A0A562TPS5_9SPHI|nr:sterol desaturase family protein [Mucilaginibacter frigoritolerans]TWI95591.1 sterol desaturase/sphingolipid hydroxylase (fatty acid hydroxylase superfamily) [Mucilaginibacter frigoritolerans]